MLTGLIRLATIVITAGAVAACGGREVQPTRTGSGVERVSPVRAAELNTRMGIGYLERGETQIALEKLQKAVEFDPDHVPAHLALGLVYDSIGREQLALNHLRQAIRLAPEDGGAHNSYATVLCRAGRYQEADRHFRQALDDPFYDTPQVVLANAGACARRGGNPESAEEYLREALIYDPGNEIALYHMAELFYEQGDAFRARAFIQRLESVSRPEPGALMLGYRIESSLGSTQEAHRYAAKLRTEFPNSREAAALRQKNEEDD